MRALTQHPKLKPSGTVKLLARTDIPLQDPHPTVGAWLREDDASPHHPPALPSPPRGSLRGQGTDAYPKE